MKTIVFTTAIAAALAASCTAHAQQGRGTDRPINEPYITSTGATVPNPGKSQSGGTTNLDRGIRRQDNKIDNSICKGC